MNEDVTAKGQWWLPDKPEKKLVGDITYGPTTGARLNLLDHFFEDMEHDRYTVWGMTAIGNPVSLFNCCTKKLTRHFNGERVVEIFSGFGVVGGHFQSSDQMKFVEVFAELTYLHEWAGTSGINVELENVRKGWQVTQKLLPDISLGSWAEFELGLKFTSRISPAYGNCNLSENCVLRLEAKTLTAYESFEEIVHQFQRFIALGVAQPVHAFSIKARTDTPEQVIQGRNFYKDHEIIRKLSLNEGTKKRLAPSEMQFCLGDLKPEPSEFVERYFGKHQQLKPVCDLYYSVLYNSDMPMQQRFLALAHAIEAYHRAVVGGKYQTNDVYRDGLQKTLWDAIPQTLDPDFRMSLKNKLKYLHEFSLRKRLQDICGKYNSILEPFLGVPHNLQERWLT